MFKFSCVAIQICSDALWLFANELFLDASLPNSFVLKDLNIDENEVIHLIVVVGGYQQSADSLGDSIPFHITVAIKKGAVLVVITVRYSY